jgi:hypothetical protein
MTESNDKQLRKQAITNGLILGVALSALSIFSFYLMTAMGVSVIFVTAGPLIFSVVLPIILAVVLCFNLRKKIGGYWNFKQAATGIFIMFLTAFVVEFVVRDMLFAKVIEPTMVQKTETAMVNTVTSVLEKSKASQEEIDKKIEDIQKQFDEQKNVSIGKQIQGVGINIIFMFVLAVMFAAMFKKEGHVYNPNLDEESKV